MDSRRLHRSNNYTHSYARELTKAASSWPSFPMYSKCREVTLFAHLVNSLLKAPDIMTGLQEEIFDVVSLKIHQLSSCYLRDLYQSQKLSPFIPDYTHKSLKHKPRVQLTAQTTLVSVSFLHREKEARKTIEILIFQQSYTDI